MNLHGPSAPSGHASPVGRGVPGAGITGTELWVARPAVPAELATVRLAVSEWGQGRRLPAEALVDLLLAVGEAAANVVDHAYRDTKPGPMEVTAQVLRRRGRRIVAARISDRGRWRPQAAAHRDRGRGLPMIRALAAHVDIAASGTGTDVCLELAVED